MRRAQGVGLAANQVYQGIRVMVMECRGNRRYPRVSSFPLQTYLNPRIIRYSKKREKDWEGCLSIPGFRGLVPRSYSVTLRAMTVEGKWIDKNFSGFEARVVQHEVDHLNGFFYVDRMPNLQSWSYLEEFNQRYHFKIRDRRS
jgi:peptide deformylase